MRDRSSLSCERLAFRSNSTPCRALRYAFVVRLVGHVDQYSMSLKQSTCPVYMPFLTASAYAWRAWSKAFFAAPISPATICIDFWLQHWSTAARHHSALLRTGRIGFPPTITK